LIPENKIIVETHGTHHFIKKVTKEKILGIKNEYNLNTEFKNECLQALGYKILNIDGQSSTNNNKSLELDFFDQYEKFIK